MADEADMAADLVAEHLAASLAAARVAVPAGVPGECDDCGDGSPRLVGGRCAPCRDRAARMQRMLGHPVAARPVDDDDNEETIMPKPQAPVPPAIVQLNLSLKPDSLALATIRRRACGGPLGPAARSLLEELVAAPPLLPDEAAPVPLDQVHFDALLAEVGRRYAQAGDRAAQDAAEARADAAERKLTQLREALAA